MNMPSMNGKLGAKVSAKKSDREGNPKKVVTA
jgi:hypothetical protein